MTIGRKSIQPLEFKVNELRECVHNMEEMEANRFLLFVSFGAVCLLFSCLCITYILFSTSVDPEMLIPLYSATAIFLFVGFGLVWNGLRRTSFHEELDRMRGRLTELEQMIFLQQVETFGKPTSPEKSSTSEKEK
jgi:H+/Cl- antiporter ClcA